MKQSITTPRQPSKPIEKMLTLKMPHWHEAMTADLPRIDPAVKTLVESLISKWADSEIAARHSTKIASRIRAARFIRVQTADTFDFDYNKSTRAMKASYLPLYHATRLENGIKSLPAMP